MNITNLISSSNNYNLQSHVSNSEKRQIQEDNCRKETFRQRKEEIESLGNKKIMKNVDINDKNYTSIKNSSNSKYFSDGESLVTNGSGIQSVSYTKIINDEMENKKSKNKNNNNYNNNNNKMHTITQTPETHTYYISPLGSKTPNILRKHKNIKISSDLGFQQTNNNRQHEKYKDDNFQIPYGAHSMTMSTQDLTEMNLNLSLQTTNHASYSNLQKQQQQKQKQKGAFHDFRKQANQNPSHKMINRTTILRSSVANNNNQNGISNTHHHNFTKTCGKNTGIAEITTPNHQIAKNTHFYNSSATSTPNLVQVVGLHSPALNKRRTSQQRNIQLSNVITNNSNNIIDVLQSNGTKTNVINKRENYTKSTTALNSSSGTYSNKLSFSQVSNDLRINAKSKQQIQQQKQTEDNINLQPLSCSAKNNISKDANNIINSFPNLSLNLTNKSTDNKNISKVEKDNKKILEEVVDLKRNLVDNNIQSSNFIQNIKNHGLVFSSCSDLAEFRKSKSFHTLPKDNIFMELSDLNNNFFDPDMIDKPTPARPPSLSIKLRERYEDACNRTIQEYLTQHDKFTEEMKLSALFGWGIQNNFV